MRSEWFLSYFLGFLTLLPWGAYAAEIKVVGQTADNIPVVSLSGNIVSDDVERFASAISGLSDAIISFDSPGGELLPGLEIGRRIRLRGFGTHVSESALCASSCAIAWLGGAVGRRTIGPDGAVGFHAAYVLQNDIAVESGYANALIGGYLSELGFNFTAIEVITSAPPYTVRILTPEIARRAQINVAFNRAVTVRSIEDNNNTVAVPEVGVRYIPRENGTIRREFGVDSATAIRERLRSPAPPRQPVPLQPNRPAEVAAPPLKRAYLCRNVRFFIAGKFSSYETFQIELNRGLMLARVYNLTRDYRTEQMYINRSMNKLIFKGHNFAIEGHFNVATGDFHLVELDRGGREIFGVRGRCDT